MNRLGIFGTSGQAREVRDIAAVLGYQTVYIAKTLTECNGCSSHENVIDENDIRQFADLRFAIGIGDNSKRKAVATRFVSQLDFVNLIHPTATFGYGQRDALDSRKGLIVCAGVRFSNNIQIGDFTLVNLNATIAHDVVIEPFVHIAAGAHISGNVHIGEGCWIGAGAVINQGSASTKLRIGARTVIGSGSVVTRDCDDNAVYVGVPARRLR